MSNPHSYVPREVLIECNRQLVAQRDDLAAALDRVRGVVQEMRDPSLAWESTDYWADRFDELLTSPPTPAPRVGEPDA